MHTRIRPAGALRQYFFSGNASNNGGQSALDAGGVRLDLPSAEFRPVVGQCQLEIAHAEIESSEMNEHPRLHRLHMSGVETNAQRVSYTVAFLRGEIRRFVYAVAEIGNPDASFYVVQL